ncbi:MAG: hypothetical protein GXN97_01110 [Aquificae bacterium]|nr:hypothetical protein [Aquificota bacterium]
MESFDTILKLRIDKEELKKIAEKEKTTMSELIRMLIYSKIGEYRKKYLPKKI